MDSIWKSLKTKAKYFQVLYFPLYMHKSFYVLKAQLWIIATFCTPKQKGDGDLY